MTKERKVIHHHTPYREAVEFAEKADKTMVIGRDHEGEPCFDMGSAVLIQHEDGTVLWFQSAFIRLYRDYVCVFTEHQGTHVYHQDDLGRWEQYRREDDPRPKLKGSGRKDYCDDCKQEFDVDVLKYGKHPDWDREHDFVALCQGCEIKARDE